MKERGRKYTRDLGHHSCCCWPPRWQKGNKIDYVIFIIWNEEGYQLFRVDKHLHGTNFWKEAIKGVLLQGTLTTVMDNMGQRRCFASLKGSVVLFTPPLHHAAVVQPGGTRLILQQDLLSPFLQSASRRDIVRRKSEAASRKGSGVGDEGWWLFLWGLCSKFEDITWIECLDDQQGHKATKHSLSECS